MKRLVLRSSSRTSAALTVLLCALFFVRIASADVVTQTAPFNFDHTGTVSSGLISVGGTYTNTVATAAPAITVPRFNLALGALNQVSVSFAMTTSTFTVAPSGLLSLVSSGSATRNFSYTVASGASTGSNSSEVTSTGAALLTLLGTGGGDIGGAPAPTATQFTSSTDLGRFSGSGNVSIQLTATDTLTVFTLVSLLNGAGLTGTGKYAGSVTVTYTYTPWAISGYVYNDLDHNGFRQSGESGTGLTLYAKLIDESAPTIAVKTATVDATTGLYGFGTSKGSYRIIVDDNALLTDVTPTTAPTGWTVTQPTTLSRSGVAVMGDLSGQDFGIIHATTACGRVFKDDSIGSGTANDGAINGGELGIASQLVQLLNPSNATLDTATTLSDGSYCLYIPYTVAGGTTLRVNHLRAPNTIATGGQIGTTGGTYSRATDIVSFNLVTSTNYTNIIFGTVPTPMLGSNGRQSGSPSTTLWFNHEFRATSAGQVTLSTSHISSSGLPPLTIVIFQDTNNNKRFDAGEPPITSALSVSTGTIVPLLIKATISPAAPAGASSQITLKADISFSNASPVLNYQLLSLDILEVLASSNAALQLTKIVDKSSVTPGGTLTYTISFTNNGTTPIRNLLIYDATPEYTTFLSASMTSVPTSLGSVAPTTPTVGAKGSLRWSFSGQLMPSSSGTLQFSVVVDP